jgi:hypothetical protein
MTAIGLFSRSLDDGQQEPCQYEVNIDMNEILDFIENDLLCPFYVKVVVETIISWCHINQIFFLYGLPR